MKLEPVISEKTTDLAGKGKYTFRVDKNLNKFQIKDLIEKIFGVNVTSVRTINIPSEVKRTTFGRKRIIHPAKKAIVTLKEKQKIDLFETKKK